MTSILTVGFGDIMWVFNGTSILQIYIDGLADHPSSSQVLPARDLEYFHSSTSLVELFLSLSSSRQYESRYYRAWTLESEEGYSKNWKDLGNWNGSLAYHVKVRGDQPMF